MSDQIPFLRTPSLPHPSPRTSQFRICIPSSTFFAGRCCHGFRTSSLSETRAISCACLSPQGKSELRGIISLSFAMQRVFAPHWKTKGLTRGHNADSLKLQRHKESSQISYPAKAVLTEDGLISVCKLDPTARCN